MNRSKLSENLSRLNETELDILTYVTKLPIDWFNDPSNSDDKVDYALSVPFSYYHPDADNNIHPMKKVYDKIVDGIYGAPLFDSVILSHVDKEFEGLAERINKLCTSRKSKYVLMALKAIAERDFQDIANEHDYDDDVTLEVFLQNFEKVYIDDFLYWLDERDLKTILLFCGEN